MSETEKKAPEAPEKKAPEAPEKATPKLGPPTKEAVARAREIAKGAASRGDVRPGTVIGLPAGWHAYTLDKGHDPGRLSHLRAILEGKGYTKADGLLVAGIANPEVWILPESVWEEDVVAKRQQRDDDNRRKWKIKQINE